MPRRQLEQIIRASGAITGASEIAIIGSQAILGAYPDAPAPLSDSIAADVFTLRDPRAATLIDGSIGEGSSLSDELCTRCEQQLGRVASQYAGQARPPARAQAPGLSSSGRDEQPRGRTAVISFPARSAAR